MFDLYGTLIDVETNEKDWYAYLNLAKYLEYRGVNLSADETRWFYFEKINSKQELSKEKYPEINAKEIWRQILSENKNPSVYDLKLNEGTFLEDMVVLHRALIRRRMRLFDNTLKVLKELKQKYKIGVVSDCQPEYAIYESRFLGIYDLFDEFIMSARFGFRKPDPRLFRMCLKSLDVSPSESIFIGDSPFRDIQGGKNAGIKTILIEQTKLDSPYEIKSDYRIRDIIELPDLIRNFN